MGQPTGDGSRWRARPLLAAAVTGAVFAVPVACSMGAAAVVDHLVARPSTTAGVAWWWLTFLGTTTVVFVASERLTRKALPLTVLLKMGMVFPGRAPKRLSVARRSWTTRDLGRRIDEAHSQGVNDEPTVAAERIVALAATLSAHDRRTRGHAERVRAVTDLIAEELRLPTDDRDRLRWSALLHDIGKLTVHSDILNKAGALSDDEWEVMRRHPLEGARLTAPLAGWLGPWAQTIAEHHERFDGRGYPFGLAGQEISTGGRIVAVADCYDTMTSLRSYKRPMPPDTARAELAACAGTQFDPVIVRAFLAVSVSRLRAAAPLSWLGSLPFGNVGGSLARVVVVGGRVGASALVTGAAVVGLAAARPAPAGPPATTLMVSGRGSGGGSGGGASGSAHDPGGGAPSHGGSPSGSAPSHGGRAGSSVTRSHPGADGAASGDGTSGQSGAAGSGNQASGGDAATTTTTVSAGGGPSSPPTTVAPGSAPPTTTTTTSVSVTTTTTQPPPLVAPGGVTLAASCQVLVLAPQVAVSWSASPSTPVTGYRVLRSTTGATGSYSTIATVSGRTTTGYTDASVSGLGTRYYYEVEAFDATSTATSTSASTVTPTLCL